MYQYSQNNVMCVEASALYSNEFNIMSWSNYKKLSQLYFEYERRGGGAGKTALVVLESIPERFKAKLEKVFGDPYKVTPHNNFKTVLQQDFKAKEYYDDYTLDNGDPLPEPRKKEYTANAAVLNAIHTVVTKAAARRRALGGGKAKMWQKLVEIVDTLPRHTYPTKLPKNTRDLRAKYEAYKGIKLSKRYPIAGYEGLIHKGYCNKNSEKINEDAKLWVLARWANQVKRCATIAQLLKEYNEKAVIESWKKLHNQDTLRIYLNSTKSLWYAHRYGELKAKEKFDYQHSTKMPSLRDSLWYSDGTKLNLYYKDEDGKMATCQVYEVMDAYSEVFLGYHISKSENYEAQYYAYKMAVQTSGYRPYEIKFDGQGGHGKLKVGNFFSKLSRIAVKTQPYNGKSKTIESAFGRFQQQILAKAWFFTGQNVTAKDAKSKANMEFILANEENLPTLKEAMELYKQFRQEWNQATHFKTNQPRIEMYYQSTNPKTPEVKLWDMVDLFWVTREKPITVSPYGILYREKNQKYNYMIYAENGMPDFDFLAAWIGKKVVVKYTPDDRSLIYLYEKTALGLRFIAAATTKIEVQRNAQEQEAYERSWMVKVNEAVSKNRVVRYQNMENILENHNMAAHQYGFNTPKIAGVKSTYQPKSTAKNSTIGNHLKDESNLVEVEATEDSIYNRY